MTLPRLQLSVIGDEIGPSLDEMISFAHEHGLQRLDMRTVGGRNLLSMKTEEVIDISRTLEKAGITVPAFVSPAFKWKAPGRSASNGGKVDFAFDPKECPVEDWVAHAMQIAVILGAPHMRIFSYLRYGGFRPRDLSRLTDQLNKLLGLAGHYDITLQLENEPVCNVGNIAELAAFFAADEKAAKEAAPDEEAEFEQDNQPKLRYLRPLVDIANSWSTGERPSDADIAVLAPFTTAIHLKDRDLSANRTVPLGDGDVPWPAELKRLLSGVETKEVLASIETHCPQDGRNATARSLAGLRRIAAEIGVEVV
ncbi:Sugar phosphate isomerase/epimerase [Rhodospirillales bacterium URHD0017]|nr:Sugar phosphate isomerase/epimerase [Rhodospirillales bacterium URHD0017]